MLASVLYALIFNPKSCADESDILPSSMEIISNFAEILPALSKLLLFWSFSITSSIIILLKSPMLILPILTIVPNFFSRELLAMFPIYPCTAGVCSSITSRKYMATIGHITALTICFILFLFNNYRKINPFLWQMEIYRLFFFILCQFFTIFAVGYYYIKVKAVLF